MMIAAMIALSGICAVPDVELVERIMVFSFSGSVYIDSFVRDCSRNGDTVPAADVFHKEYRRQTRQRNRQEDAGKDAHFARTVDTRGFRRA